MISLTTHKHFISITAGKADRLSYLIVNKTVHCLTFPHIFHRQTSYLVTLVQTQLYLVTNIPAVDFKIKHADVVYA